MQQTDTSVERDDDDTSVGEPTADVKPDNNLHGWLLLLKNRRQRRFPTGSIVWSLGEIIKSLDVHHLTGELRNITKLYCIDFTASFWSSPW